MHDLFTATDHRKATCHSVANVFSGNVITKLRSGGKSCICLDVRNIGILYAKNCEDQFKLL